MQNRDVGSLTDIFPDVSSDEYYAKYIGWAQENGLVSGYPDGNFHPDDNITREQLAAIVNKYIQMRNDPLDTVQDIKPFSDTKNISDWAAQAVQNMQKYELMSGKIDNAFAPKESLTRAEAAVVITRLYESIRYPTENSANYQSIRCRSDNQDERVLTNGLAAKYGEDEHIRYQCISDYDTYMEIVNRAKQNASPLSSETQDFQLLDESFFQEHNVIAIELNHYGSPQYQTKLSNSSEMGTTGDAPDFWLDAEFFSRNASGATADSVSYIFFIEVSKHITKANIITETHRVEGFSTFMP